MKRFLAFFMSFALILGFPVHAQEVEEPQGLYAQSAVLMDADSGRVLFEKNGTDVKAMASTTKIMTCILTLEKGNLDDIVTISENAAAQPKVHLGVQEGEQVQLRDLLYSLMLESHNDSAVAIAEHMAGTTEKFADIMNEKALELGCAQTHFVTPNGLDEEDEGGAHSTTAKDLATIMCYCITKSTQAEEFLKITATPTYSFSTTDGSRTFHCTNRNSFLSMMEGAISGKTGYTGKAGYCYVGAVKREERTFVVALLACGWPNHKNYKWKDTLKLMEYGVENYAYHEMLTDVELPSIEIVNGIPNNDNMYDKSYVDLEVDTEGHEVEKVLLRNDESIEIRTKIKSKVKAPVMSGTKVGEVGYYLHGEKIKEYPIVVKESVGRKNLSWYFEKVLAIFVGLTYE